MFGQPLAADAESQDHRGQYREHDAHHAPVTHQQVVDAVLVQVPRVQESTEAGGAVRRAQGHVGDVVELTVVVADRDATIERDGEVRVAVAVPPLVVVADGVRDVVLCDSRGTVRRDRHDLNAKKREHAVDTAARTKRIPVIQRL